MYCPECNKEVEVTAMLSGIVCNKCKLVIIDTTDPKHYIDVQDSGIIKRLVPEVDNSNINIVNIICIIIFTIALIIIVIELKL